MKQRIQGPFSYKNWKAALSGGQPGKWMHEVPLFTDAHITGEFADGIGPYQIINAGSPVRSPSRIERPLLVLRIQNFREFEIPEMSRTNDAHYHGGSEADEIAALISLCFGIPLKAGPANRIFATEGDPRGRPIAIFSDEPIHSRLRSASGRILKNESTQHSLPDEARILTTLPSLAVEDAIALVRAARMYQEAVWIAEATPELSWIMLVSAVETVAHQWRKKKESPVERMRAFQPDLESILREYAGNRGYELVDKVAHKIADYMGSFAKFRDFLIEFMPLPPPARPPEFARVSWEEKPMITALRKIYTYRSRALHSGIPFPAPMCQSMWIAGENGELAEIPAGLAASMRGGVWVIEDTPMLLHVFEYIVRNALLKWWKSIAADNGDAR